MQITRADRGVEEEENAQWPASLDLREEHDSNRLFDDIKKSARGKSWTQFAAETRGLTEVFSPQSLFIRTQMVWAKVDPGLSVSIISRDYQIRCPFAFVFCIREDIT